jgi:hypothetical protein
VDVPGLLRQAAAELPAGLPRADLDDYLAHDEWEVALEVLLDRGDEFAATTSFFQTLEEAADRMRLQRSAAWCAWRRREVLHGVVRAEVRLVPGAGGAGIAGGGLVRALWDIGLVTPAGAPDLAVALVWVEYALDLPPGGAGSVRLAPITALRWDHLQPGDRITMHNQRRSDAGRGAAAGIATVTEAGFPAGPGRR